MQLSSHIETVPFNTMNFIEFNLNLIDTGEIVQGPKQVFGQKLTRIAFPKQYPKDAFR